jgi:hypothetical protein
MYLERCKLQRERIRNWTVFATFSSTGKTMAKTYQISTHGTTAHFSPQDENNNNLPTSTARTVVATNNTIWSCMAWPMLPLSATK